MLYLLSPAKALDYETPLEAPAGSAPLFGKQSDALIAVLRQKSPQEIATLMRISDKLATLNVARYEAWRSKPAAQAVRPAVLAFAGDVYQTLEARSLSAAQLDWMQGHVCILSGLYGVLRPLDRMQPHRLEMGTRLATAGGSNLYQFWGSRIAEYLNQRLDAQPERIVVNLASQEYFKSVDRNVLDARVIDCVFEDWKGGKYKVISFHAKRARGLMVRWAALHAVHEPTQLQGFDLGGYDYAADASEPERLVFRRREAAAA